MPLPIAFNTFSVRRLAVACVVTYNYFSKAIGFKFDQKKNTLIQFIYYTGMG